jgi:hypothetical protein
MRKATEGVADRDTQLRLTQTVSALESTVGTRGFADCYRQFVADVADHMTVFAPFLPALSELLLDALRR